MKQIFTTLILLLSINTWAYTPSTTAEISVITCSPGKEVYKIYGHSAIRFHDQGRDLVFNYGLFSFDEPHFIWRYLQGKNYYLLGIESYKRFIKRYEQGGERVTQQVLNLDHKELVTLYAALMENAKPENRKYLYNVFYDNCATRAYRIIEDHLAGGIDWDNTSKNATFRELLHEHNHTMPFSQLGIDIVFGSKADHYCSYREQMFLPKYLKEELETAQKSDGSALIASSEELLTGRTIHNNKEIILFNLVLALLLVGAILLRYLDASFLRTFQIIIYTLVGLCSLVVCFIAFFSIHPTVLPNLNLLWINPLWLILATGLIFNKRLGGVFQKLLNYWSIVMALFLMLGITGVFYIHYGLIYIISTLVVISYKRYY